LVFRLGRYFSFRFNGAAPGRLSVYQLFEDLRCIVIFLGGGRGSLALSGHQTPRNLNEDAVGDAIYLIAHAMLWRGLLRAYSP
jgi:hypothetical protein